MGLSFGGASAAAQALAFAISFAFGLPGGVAALLFLRKARPVERALTDLTASAALIALYFLSLEIGSDGQPAIFNFAAFVLGAVVIPALFSALKRKLKRKAKKTDDVDGEKAPQSGSSAIKIPSEKEKADKQRKKSH